MCDIRIRELTNSSSNTAHGLFLSFSTLKNRAQSTVHHCANLAECIAIGTVTFIRVSITTTTLVFRPACLAIAYAPNVQLALRYSAR